MILLWEIDTDVDPKLISLMQTAADCALLTEGVTRTCAVNIRLCDDEAIHEINRDWRGVDRATDVLSFPMQDFYHGECEFMEYSLDPESGRLPLGDMVLSVERARAQGEEFGHGFRRECAYLTVHSCLHLLGYDHLDEGPEKKLMREKEEIIMDRLGLRREMTLEESK